MLNTLRIQNFALIDQVEIHLDTGYTVITGETGSGKSILLNALSLILGERADFSVIGPNSDKAIVEAVFEIKGFHLEDFFRDNDLDIDDKTIIRREINTGGKSRAFINDTPVSLTVLKELTGSLVNIHSQYNTLELKNRSYQLEILDTLADLNSIKANYSSKFKKFQSKKTKLTELKLVLSHALQQQDYNKFQLTELEELNLDQNNYQSLEAELLKVENGEELQISYAAIIGSLDDDDQVIDKLRTLKSILDKADRLDENIKNLSERIHSVLIELEDLVSDATRFADSVEIDPEKLKNLTEYLNRYNHILKKHNALTQDDLISLRDRLESEILNSEETQNEINLLEMEVEMLSKEVWSDAKVLHENRLKNIDKITTELQAILEELKLPNTKLEFHLNEREELNSTGITDVTFLFSANVGIESVPIEKAASGGELSRLMLALQKMISEKKLLPTVLFDEIDTGVSGDVAQKIGNLLSKMGSHFQLIAISHLPQVAAKASNHFKVEKELNDNRTNTSVNKLNSNERVEEIARLMSGEEITTAALETAKLLMN